MLERGSRKGKKIILSLFFLFVANVWFNTDKTLPLLKLLNNYLISPEHCRFIHMKAIQRVNSSEKQICELILQ